MTHLFAVNPFDPYPHDEPRPSPTSAPSVHRYCRTCDVKWEAPGDCWICGNTGTRATPTEPIGGVARMNHTENP